MTSLSSFAGADRDIAQRLYELLSEVEVGVFYDMNEQHRILAANVGRLPSALIQ